MEFTSISDEILETKGAFYNYWDIFMIFRNQSTSKYYTNVVLFQVLKEVFNFILAL